MQSSILSGALPPVSSIPKRSTALARSPVGSILTNWWRSRHHQHQISSPTITSAISAKACSDRALLKVRAADAPRQEWTPNNLSALYPHLPAEPGFPLSHLRPSSGVSRREHGGSQSSWVEGLLLCRLGIIRFQIVISGLISLITFLSLLMQPELFWDTGADQHNWALVPWWSCRKQYLIFSGWRDCVTLQRPGKLLYCFFCCAYQLLRQVASGDTSPPGLPEQSIALLVSLSSTSFQAY